MSEDDFFFYILQFWLFVNNKVFIIVWVNIRVRDPHASTRPSLQSPVEERERGLYE